LTEPATSSAIASPYPTVSAAFSTIVFSAILRPLSLESYSLRIVEAYLDEHSVFVEPVESLLGSEILAIYYWAILHRRFFGHLQGHRST
jgi:hypothetical protein